MRETERTGETEETGLTRTVFRHDLTEIKLIRNGKYQLWKVNYFDQTD